jgi:pimeloyl-ACP methyl ester carboxylesterase
MLVDVQHEGSPMMRVRFLTPLFALLLLVACSVAPPPAEVETFEIDGFTTQAVIQSITSGAITIDCTLVGPLGQPVTFPALVETVAGETLSGAEYLFFRPLQWNDSLVLFARGYLPPSAPVGFPDPLPADVVALRDALLCQGFAVGASSYSANGLAIREGIEDTHLLNPLFEWHFDLPAKTYVMGQSMGGLITVALMEFFPDVYDGALPMCGPTAGSLAQLQYLGHVRVLADYFFPSLFRENAVTPTRKTMQQVEFAVDRLAPPLLLQLGSIHLPGGEAFGLPILPVDPAATTPAARLQSLRASLKEALYYYVVGMQDVLDRGGGQPFDNRLTVYASDTLSPLELGRLNARVDRFAADASAVDYWSQFQPRGVVGIPTINLHTAFDPAVPFAHAVVYEQTATFMGTSANLMTVPVLRYGHCNFELEELVAGFGTLVQWVQSGARPALP